jgi:hypothetical protein
VRRVVWMGRVGALLVIENYGGCNGHPLFMMAPSVVPDVCVGDLGQLSLFF